MTADTFCLVVAAISCLGVPQGTVLGVLTILVLNRSSVERTFDTAPVVADHRAAD